MAVTARFGAVGDSSQAAILTLKQLTEVGEMEHGLSVRVEGSDTEVSHSAPQGRHPWGEFPADCQWSRSGSMLAYGESGFPKPASVVVVTPNHGLDGLFDQHGTAGALGRFLVFVADGMSGAVSFS